MIKDWRETIEAMKEDLKNHDLPTRVYQGLINSGFGSLFDAAQSIKNDEREFLRIPNFGRGSLDILKQYLMDIGLWDTIERRDLSSLCGRQIAIIENDSKGYIVLKDAAGKAFAVINPHYLFDEEGNYFRDDL